MMGRVWAIAFTTFREAIRSKVLYGILVVGSIMFFSSIVLGECSLHEEARVTRDTGLSGISFFGSVTAIVLGISLLYNEIQRRTIHTIISKPLERYEFVLGKYGGMAMTLTVLVGGFAISMMVLLWLQDVPFSSTVTKAIVLSYMEVLVVAGIALLFSSFSTPFLSGIFTFALFVIGRLTPEMREALDSSKIDWLKYTCRAALRLVPDLHLFSVSGGRVKGEYVSVHGDFVTWGYVATAGMYAALFLTILITLAVIIFGRRDFS